MKGGSLPQVERWTENIRVSELESMQVFGHALHKTNALVCAASGRMTVAIKWSSISIACRSSSGPANGPRRGIRPASAFPKSAPKISLVT